jgi:CHAT domain-containing protein
MQRFYVALGEGLPVTEALQHARMHTRERYPDPFYWSAFVAVGLAD